MWDSTTLGGSKKGWSLDWIRALLPGIFVEVYHWKERALRAEKQLSEVVGQYSTTIAHERELHAAERRELLSMLAGNTSQKPPQSADVNDGSGFTVAPSFIHPIQRAIDDFKANQSQPITDEMIEAGVEEYLRMSAVH